MTDQITINIRALDERTLEKLETLLDEQLNIIPDDTNDQALEDIRQFED
ncbi:MAG: hypothetical protein ACUZ8H_04010 [Candidatus Anammoxibacter sp.]